MIIPFSAITQMNAATTPSSWLQIFDSAVLTAEQIPSDHVAYFRQISAIADLSSQPYFDYQPTDSSADLISSDEDYASQWISAAGVEIEIGQTFDTETVSRYRTKLVNQGLEVNLNLVSDLSGGYNALQTPANQPLWVRIMSSLSGSDSIKILVEGQIQPLSTSQVVLNLSSGGSGTLSLGGQTLVVV